MEAVTLLIAVAALVIAIIAFSRTGGIADVRRQMENVTTRTDSARDRTADLLDRLERLIRGREKGGEREDEPGSRPEA